MDSQTVKPVHNEGSCEVCGDRVPLAFRDPDTGMKYGACCHAAMTIASRLLNYSVKHFGLRHPQPT